MTATGFNVRTKEIGDELARLIRTGSGSFGTGLKVCQFGAVEQVVAPSRLSAVIPAVIVKPVFSAAEPVDVAGLLTEVEEEFRICYAFRITKEAVYDVASDGLNSLVPALTADRRMGTLTLAGGDRVISSDPIGIEWDGSPEDLLLADEKTPVKVVVLRWKVLWRAA